MYCGLRDYLKGKGIKAVIRVRRNGVGKKKWYGRNTRRGMR